MISTFYALRFKLMVKYYAGNNVVIINNIIVDVTCQIKKMY